MRRHLYYLIYTLRHKWYVFVACRQFGVPLWIAICHDWDKFWPMMWIAYAHNYYEANGTRRYLQDPRFLQAQNNHRKRNKHHWQYWVMVSDRGKIECLPMPDVYRREMIADWIGAGLSMNDPELSPWVATIKDSIHLNPDTLAWIEAEIERRGL